MGGRMVVDLRREREHGEHSTVAERRAVEGAGRRYINIPMKVRLPTHKSQVPWVFSGPGKPHLSTTGGARRTGTVIAYYRISHDGWTSEQALSEVISLGLGLHRMKFGMQVYIQRFRRP